MRVAICTESYPPSISGVSVFCANAAAELKARGHQVIILAPSPKGKPYREVQNGIVIQRIRSIRSPFKKKLRYVMGQHLAVSAILRRFKPDIIHIQDLGGSSAAGLRWGRRRGTVVVGTQHFTTNLAAVYFPLAKLLPEETLYSMIEAYVREFFNLCTVMTCPTNIVREGLVAAGAKVPIVVISNGVDIPPLPNIAQRRKNETPIVLCVGRVDEDKNLLLLFQAAAIVRAQHPVQFVIVGDGGKLKTYREYVRRNNLSDCIRFTGAIKPTSVILKNWYARANVFVIPSLIETQSIVVLEAMAAALPVVAVRAGALPELVKHKETGFLSPVATSSHFAKAILAALNDPKKAEEYGLGGRELVERVHERKHCMDELMNLYEKALAGTFKR